MMALVSKQGITVSVSVSPASLSPHLGMLALEPIRALLQFTRMKLTRNVGPPKSGGHAIVFFPGLGADARSMEPLAKHCRRLGYTCYHWGRGVNRGPSGDPVAWIRDLSDEVSAMLAHERRGVTLVGWSLGGLYAREIAKRMTGRVRQVITMGTPVARFTDSTNVRWLFRLLSGSDGAVDQSLAKALATPPPVPTTSIYSRSDGVVAWKACQSEAGPLVENVEVASSHLGLIWHPHVMRVVENRLAQPRGRWKPWMEVLTADAVAS